ncbi:hypothetical protein BMS3Bbin10_00040 [bacterium BMS3Bbin10]|nr:hypothetical protein BMS3Bbin10_00040 [bacterium BMS3Bbin10]HDL16349.1 DUF302 domain-containing protein [Hyphomicrobiales bacterium]
MKFTNMIAAALLTLFLATPGESAVENGIGYKSISTEGSFETILFELKNAIIDRGLKIDYEGYLQEMLERTSQAAGSVTAAGNKTPYLNARFLQFCSAKLTHEVVSANPLNIAICPYVVFIYEVRGRPGVIHVGYRKPISDRSIISRKALAKVEALLDGIVADAVK